MKNKNGLWIFILSLVMVSIAVVALIGTIVCELIGNHMLFQIFGITLAVSGPLSIVLLILKLVLYGGAEEKPEKTPEVKTYKYNEDSIPIVDVKEYKKSKDEILYEKYVDLYNKKIISKEDLDKKREELLHK